MSQQVLFEPRLCLVEKRPDFDGYGFNLHAEKGKPGQYIGKVDEHSPAESSGLRQGDRILEVNGQSINSETHKQVVERIKVIPNQTKLLVIDPKADIHNHQQMALIDKIKKEAELKAVEADHQNNNNNSGTAVMINSNGNADSEKLIKEEVKQEEMNGNGASIKSDNEHIDIAKLDISNGNGNSNGNVDKMTTASKLNLSMSVAEMRAQLKNKKRPDPKSEGIDVRKKYEIIQKM
ncbi:Na(+)/H(+) exchange regulatory cofactor NHE-RF1-like [Chironomus tepperi]|uniref:Na(+)/H(+) exchange regulatory cofactor NHE-RF1-like n=1 Tax=Chironomus tepperi TaxID=113505 RepID=UPI00391F8FF5